MLVTRIGTDCVSLFGWELWDSKEWLEYHRLAGVDHIYWRDRVNHGRQPKNGKGTNEETIAPYVEEGFATYIPGPVTINSITCMFLLHLLSPLRVQL